MLKYDLWHLGAAAGSNEAQSWSPIFNHFFEQLRLASRWYEICGLSA